MSCVCMSGVVFHHSNTSKELETQRGEGRQQEDRTGSLCEDGGHEQGSAHNTTTPAIASPR